MPAARVPAIVAGLVRPNSGSGDVDDRKSPFRTVDQLADAVV